MKKEENLEKKVVVITGASSGNGRSMAQEFAKERARIVLAARREDKLLEVVKEVVKLGGEAIAVPTEITNLESVHNLLKESIGKWGDIDIWINNAAVTAFGRFEEIPFTAFKRVLDVNVMGYVYGSYYALQQFKKKKEGTLINVSSVVGVVSQPFAAPYVASKFAIKGLTQCLRQENEDKDIEICMVLPATIDTPFFQHAANYSGKKISTINPVYKAKDVGETVVKLAKHPQREVKVGVSANMLISGHALAAETTENAFAEQAKREQFENKDAPISNGNLFEPIDDNYGVSAGWA
jgi:short-subunit dehydrogenase